MSETRDGWTIEVDDGVIIARQGDVSITVAANTATLNIAGSSRPATKEPLDEFFPEKVLALLAHSSQAPSEPTNIKPSKKGVTEETE